MPAPPKIPHPAPRPPDIHAALPRLDRQKPKGTVRASKMGKRRAAVLIGVYVLVGIHVLWWHHSGSTLTPVEPSEAMKTLDYGVINAGFVLFALTILSTLVLGRWFCGWACHVVALQDLCAWMLKKLGLKPRPVRSRLLVLTPFAVAFYMFVWPTAVRLWMGVPAPSLRSEFLTDELWQTFPGWVMSIATLLVVGFLIVWWLGAKGFCTYGCPYGAFFGVADRFAPMRIRVTDACTHCGHCTSVCSSNVRVHEEVAMHGMVVDPGCMKCMDCVSVCPNDALYFGPGRIAPLTSSQQRVRARADFTWPEEIALAVLAIGAVLAFRGAWFLERVPLLLSVGLGVITAVFGLLWYRLLRRPDVVFQHAQLKSQARFTRAGRLALVLVSLWLLLAIDTGMAQFAIWRGRAAAEIASRADVAPSERRAAIDTVVRWLDRAAALAPLADPAVHQLLGIALRERGDFDRSERELRRALDILPDLPEAAIPLTDLLQRRGAYDEIEPLLRSVLRQHPDNVMAQRRLELLQQMRQR